MIRANVYYDGGWVGYDVPSENGEYIQKNREYFDEDIHFFVLDGFVAAATDQEEILLYRSNQNAILANGEKIDENNEVKL